MTPGDLYRQDLPFSSSIDETKNPPLPYALRRNKFPVDENSIVTHTSSEGWMPMIPNVQTHTTPKPSYPPVKHEPVVPSIPQSSDQNIWLDVNRPVVPDNLRVNAPVDPPDYFPTSYPSFPTPAQQDPSSVFSYPQTAFHGEICSEMPRSLSLRDTDHQDPSHHDLDSEEDLPFFEELGVNPEHIWKRMKSVLLFHTLDQNLLSDVDMCGPLFIAACLGFFSLLAGKIYFGYIYVLSVTGSLGLCILLNLMSQKNSISLYSTVSILGYGLFPVVLLSCLSALCSLKSLFGAICSVFCVLWCTTTASLFFETALEMAHQRYLVAYPIFLLYGSFVLITVF